MHPKIFKKKIDSSPILLSHLSYIGISIYVQKAILNIRTGFVTKTIKIKFFQHLSQTLTIIRNVNTREKKKHNNK